MDQSSIKSTDFQSNHHFSAPHGLRIGAWLIDCIILAIVFAMLPQPLPYILFISLLIAYHAISLWLVQQTVGKALLGLKVYRIGSKPGFFWALGRCSVGYFIVDLLGVGLLVALFNRRHRALHDYVFNSTVFLDETGPLNAKLLLSRLLRLIERQLDAIKARRKTVSILGGFWGFLFGLGRGLKRIIDFLTGLGSGDLSAASAPSIAEAISLKAAAGITAMATAATGVLVTSVPQTRALGKWLLEPRYILTSPAAIVSTFERDVEDWKVFGDAQGQSDEPTYDDGAIMATDDQQSDVWYWRAPEAYLGDKRGFYGRDLVFKLRTSNVDNPFDDQDLVLEGGDLTLIYNTQRNPATEWTEYRVRLDESAPWTNKTTGKRVTRAEFLQVMSDLRQLLIRGEYREGGDTGWLDDVIFGAGPLMRIEAVEYPRSIVSDAPRTDLVVAYSGEPRFPVELIFRPRSCPPGYNCFTERAKFATPPRERRLTGKGFVWCAGVSEVWKTDFEVVVRDSLGTETSEPIAVVCQPVS